VNNYKDEILACIAQHKDEITRLGVKRLALFGSAARNEASQSSDLDFLVEFNQKSFDNYMDLKFYLEDLFERPVDLVLVDTIKPHLRDAILNEAVHAPVVFHATESNSRLEADQTDIS